MTLGDETSGPSPLPRLILFDLHADRESRKVDFSAKLIDVDDAISILASGGVDRPFPAKPWYAFNDQRDAEVSEATGRHYLAEELIREAIGEGRLHCVVVAPNPSGSGGSRLEAIDPAQFRGEEWDFDWSDGPAAIRIDSGTAALELPEFQLLWDELCVLRPSLANLESAQDHTNHATQAPPPGIIARGQVSKEPRTTRRGRPSGRHGEAIANFTVRIQGDLDDALSVGSDDALGAMLIEEYEKLGLPPPSLGNAAKDARGVVTALMKVREGSTGVGSPEFER